ncbi:MAG: CehA/McbA family metallohydrolase [Lentisphaerae bacterium]|jgi:hypothetical protein|nr:CehA/McbA family metallohydrolase [Lentisphaerota bacterium]MBT4822921.1 CehA/McbA family metallohydrolase [Lentisphaerota bacterium]MBT5609770.1 CehA/McbA family metallohydrolase [Lentisphaerota bacterium]MBT7061412.1 CehA/McbA family metallohydrolase [Lentisphaerota bacterium]MBT7845102.1 CehA/McbA family metallohydrolase [Lentisphaerota bacterium]
MTNWRTFGPGLLTVWFLFGSEFAAANPVKNPGFEEVADRVPVTWGLPKVAGAAFAVDETTAHSGKRSGRITGTDPKKQTRFVQAWRQDVPLAVGKGVHWVTGWVRAEQLQRGQLNVLHKSAAGAVLKNQSLTRVDGTFAWKRFAFELRPPEEATSMQLVLGLQKSTGSIWFDDIAIEMREKTDLGQALLRVEGAPVAAGKSPVEAVFKLGKTGLSAGDKLVFQWDNWRTSREFRLLSVTARCAVEGARFECRKIPRKKSWPPVPRPVDWEATLVNPERLSQGVVVSLGGTLTMSRHSNVKAGLVAGAILAGTNAPAPVSTPLVIQAQGGPPAALACSAEARPVRGTPGRVTVAATDRFGNPASGFRGTITFHNAAGTDLPPSYTFTEADGGTHTFQTICPAEGVTRVGVTCGDWSATANPVLPRREDEPMVLFGDIHSHCEISGDGVGDPDLAYEYARGFHGLDFAALSDHSPKGARWKRAVTVANRHNAPGRFVALLGFEWSSKPRGHRNAYYPGDDAPQQPVVKNNMQAWWDWLAKRNEEAIIIPHHTNTQAAQIMANGRPAWEPCDWSVINHRYQRVVEICQNRGSFEAPGGPIKELRIKRKDVGASVQTALAMGHRLAFIGSTDTHSGRPGTGDARVAAMPGSFTRRGIWQAMHDRKCYATTGQHTLVFFSVNDEPMGSELQVAGDAPRAIRWRVVGTTAIKRVDLLRNNAVVKSWEGRESDDLTGAFTLSVPLTATEWWYVRAIQVDTHLAWSSPVWLDPRAP